MNYHIVILFQVDEQIRPHMGNAETVSVSFETEAASLKDVMDRVSTYIEESRKVVATIATENGIKDPVASLIKMKSLRVSTFVPDSLEDPLVSKDTIAEFIEEVREKDLEFGSVGLAARLTKLIGKKWLLSDETEETITRHEKNFLAIQPINEAEAASEN